MPQPTSPPPLPVRIEFTGRLAPVLGDGQPLRVAVAKKLDREIRALCVVLGIPGHLELSFFPSTRAAINVEEMLHVFVHGRRCAFSAELVQRVESYVLGRPLAPGRDLDALLDWLAASAAEPRAEFLTLLCLETLKLQPGCLLDEVVAAACLAEFRAAIQELATVSWPTPRWFLPALRSVLHNGISLADRAAAGRACSDGVALALDQEMLAERLIGALRSNVVEIRTTEEFLRELTTRNRETDLFPMLRDGLFYELGIVFPPFRFVSDASLPVRSVAVTVNHLTQLPWCVLDPDRCLVNTTLRDGTVSWKVGPEGLSAPATSALNPANLNECAIIDANFRLRAEAGGLVAWGQIGYAILCLAAELRRAAPRCLDDAGTRALLDQLNRVFPELVQAARHRFPDARLAGVLRKLLDEECSIRNLRAVLEHLIDFDPIPVDASKTIVFDDRLTVPENLPATRIESVSNLVSTVRCGLKKYISHKASAGRSTLPVFLIDPDMEAMVVSASVALPPDDALPPTEEERFRKAVHEKVRSTPSGDKIAILTTVEVRPLLASLLRTQYPRMRVLAYQELSPEMNVQPIERIALGSD